MARVGLRPSYAACWKPRACAHFMSLGQRVAARQPVAVAEPSPCVYKGKLEKGGLLYQRKRAEQAVCAGEGDGRRRTRLGGPKVIYARRLVPGIGTRWGWLA